MNEIELLKKYEVGERSFRGAYLENANLGMQWIIQGPARSDGYFFCLMKLDQEKEPMIRAGCRWFSMEDARTHWRKTRAGTPLGDETFEILDSMERIAKIRGLI